MTGYFELLESDTGKFRFNLKAGNHETILTSESYESKDAAKKGIESVKMNATLADSYDRRSAKDGAPYFVLLAGNRQVIGRSEMYSGAEAMEKGIESVRLNASSAEIKDKTG